MLVGVVGHHPSGVCFVFFAVLFNFINWVSNYLLSRRNNIKLNFIDIHDHDTRERIFVIIYNM